MLIPYTEAIPGTGGSCLTGISVISLGISSFINRLCGLVVRVLGYRSGGSGSIPGTTRKKK
jgi:hypothetical protein